MIAGAGEWLRLLWLKSNLTRVGRISMESYFESYGNGKEAQSE